MYFSQLWTAREIRKLGFPDARGILKESEFRHEFSLSVKLLPNQGRLLHLPPAEKRACDGNFQQAVRAAAPQSRSHDGGHFPQGGENGVYFFGGCAPP
jgi:hypothetical protein